MGFRLLTEAAQSTQYVGAGVGVGVLAMQHRMFIPQVGPIGTCAGHHVMITGYINVPERLLVAVGFVHT
jgi:hypothetical protein